MLLPINNDTLHSVVPMEANSKETFSFLRMNLASSRMLRAQTCKAMVAAVYSSRVLIVQKDIAGLFFLCSQLHCLEYCNRNFISWSHQDLSIVAASYCVSARGLSKTKQYGRMPRGEIVQASRFLHACFTSQVTYDHLQKCGSSELQSSSERSKRKILAQS